MPLSEAAAMLKRADSADRKRGTDGAERRRAERDW